MDLFGDEPPAAAPSPAPARPGKTPRPKNQKVLPATPEGSLQALASQLPAGLHLGTSSWNFPGWKGLVWDGDHSESTLSRHGLAAYSGHPVLRTVSLDRAFYQPLSASQYAHYAAQVPEGFRFLVKAPSLVADALVRSDDGRGMQDNTAFLDPELAVTQFVQPAIEGLGNKAGALVFQLSPLPGRLLARFGDVLERLARMLDAVAIANAQAQSIIAVEVRNRDFLVPEFARVLKRTGAAYCVGLHAKMPPIEEQLPLLRALWPGPLVCRWNLHRKHGAYGYEDAMKAYDPFDKLVDPDPQTRDALARVIAGTTGAGYQAIVTINNKAEGSAPLSVLELARAVADKVQRLNN